MENPGFETTRLATNVYGIFVVDDVAIAALYDLQFSEPIIRFIHVLQQHRFVCEYEKMRLRRMMPPSPMVSRMRKDATA